MNAERDTTTYPLSPLQQGILFHTLYAPHSGMYLMHFTCKLRGVLEVDVFREAWEEVVARHSILRTSFHWSDADEPYQQVHTRAELELPQEDWRDLTSEEQDRRLNIFKERNRTRGFDLGRPPLMRLTLIRQTDHESLLAWTFHHLILDGQSVAIILREVLTRYDARLRGDTTSSAPARPYSDYIAWLQSRDLSGAEAYWRTVLEGFEAPGPLSTGHVAHSAVGSSAASRSIPLAPTLAERVQALAAECHVTPNTVMMGAWALLLSRYTGAEDIVFGITVSHRPSEFEGINAMAGMFVSALPVRVNEPAQAALRPWLQEIRASVRELRRYAYSPLVEIGRWSGVPAGTPLFESVVVFKNADLYQAGVSETVQVEVVKGGNQTNYPLTLVVGHAASPSLTIEYDTSRFDETAIDRMLGHLVTIVHGMVDAPDRPLSEMPLLTPAERHTLMVTWNDTARSYPMDRCLHNLLEEQVERTPEAVAVCSHDAQLTYRELNARANQLARYLRGLGAGPEVLVGICLERSLEMVVALLAVLKAGAALVPLDPSYPRERLSFMLEDTRAPLVVTAGDVADQLPLGRCLAVHLDAERARIGAENAENLSPGVTPQNLAYAIYTSGTTGRPKGVLVPQEQLLNRCAWMWEAYPFAQGEVCCQKTNMSFVDFFWELLGPLLRGVPVAIVPDDIANDPQRLVPFLAARGVTRLWLSPALLAALLDTYSDLQERVPALRIWHSSGDLLPLELFRRFREQMPDSLLLNPYGTSETNDTTIYDPRYDSSELGAVPVGRPIANRRVYLLDELGRLVPPGVPGELHIGGIGLARGYLNLPELTQEKFIPDPFGETPGARLYRTGDLAQYRSDGQLEYLGRIDRQVKIRGVRIEPREIEVLLREHPAVREAVVVAREDAPGERRLIAYLVTRGEQIERLALWGYLKERLPSSMVPAAVVMLESLPFTPNGKIDRKALPAPDPHWYEGEETFVQPRHPAEVMLAGIWREVLRVPRVGVYDTFFELGGHSLLATQVLARVRDAFGVELPLRALFETPTIAALAPRLEREVRIASPRMPSSPPEILAQLDGLTEEEIDALLLQMTAQGSPDE